MVVFPCGDLLDQWSQRSDHGGFKSQLGPPGDAVTTAIKSFQNYDLWIIHRFPIPISEFIEWDEKLCFIRSTS